MHRTLARQISDATNTCGDIDPVRLISSVRQSYAAFERERRMTTRSIGLMVSENEQLTRELEERMAALRLQNARFIGAIESLSHGLCVYDAEDRLVIANRRYAELYGLTAAVLVPGVRLLDVVADVVSRGQYADPAVLEDARGTLEEIAAEGACERMRPLADGRIIHVTFNRLEDGGWIALHKDVTSQRQAQQQLADSEAKLRDFLDTASDWTWETDPEGRVVALSQAYDSNGAFDRSAMMGLRREEHPVIPEHRERMAQDYTRRMGMRQPIRNFVYGVSRPDGSVNYIRVSGNPAFDCQGAFTGYRGTSTNVTPQVEASIALEQSNERFRDFAETAADWCWETDEEHRYVDPDSFHGRRATFGSKDYIGKRRIDLPVAPEDRPVLEAHMLDLAARRPFKDMLYRMPEENGSLTWIKATGMPIFDAAGRFRGYRGSARDVSEEELRKLDLKQTLDSFRDFAEAASDWFWETDEQHRFKGFSEAYQLVAKLASLQHVGKTRLEFNLHPDDRPGMEAHFADLNAHKPFKDLLYRVRGTQQDWVWIRANGKPVFDADGVFTGYRGSASHVTEEMDKREQLAQQRVALERAGEVAQLGYWRWRADTRSFDWSESIYDILGFRPHERHPDLRKLVARVHPEDQPWLVMALKEMEEGRLVTERDYRFQREPGDAVRYFQLKVDIERDAKGSFTGIFGIVQDITDLKLAELKLKERSQQLIEAQKLGRIGDWSYRLGTRKVWWAREIFTLLGHEPDSFDTSIRALRALCVGDGMRQLIAALSQTVRDGAVRSVDVKARRADGAVADFVVTAKALVDAAGQVIGLSGTVQDITERKRAEEQLEKLAYFDPLTGLANRALFRREIDEVLDRAHRAKVSAALLLLDLDRFKEVNDSLGHAAGDELLAKVAQLISREIGPACFLARLGGDEFAVILPDCSEEGVIERTANAIIRAVSEPLDLERGEVHIGTSIGVVLIPQDGQDSEELMRHADLALYRAKEDGRGRFAFFASDMNDLVQQKTALARDLRHASADGAGLEARYQPQIDLANNLVVGFEALMRWKHPVHGYVPPGEFIPIAESSSLICDLGLWILRESALQARRWLDSGQPEREMSVNVSAAQIWQTELEADVALILEQTGLPPHLLCLELTESLFANHSEGRVRGALTALKKLGVTLALDDFGTGYSSLGYLTQLPFDKLKIDRVFVNGIVGSARKRKLLEGIVALGRGLGMMVIAEGAEQAEEVAILHDFGCDRVQGFVYARPTMAAEALAFAESRHAAYAAEPGSLAGQLRRIARRGR